MDTTWYVFVHLIQICVWLVVHINIRTKSLTKIRLPISAEGNVQVAKVYVHIRSTKGIDNIKIMYSNITQNVSQVWVAGQKKCTVEVTDMTTKKGSSL